MDDYAYESGITSRIKGGGCLPRLLARLPMLLMLSLAFLLEFSCSREKLFLLAAFPNQFRCDGFTLLPLTAQLLGLGRQWLGDPWVTFFQVQIHRWALESTRLLISVTERLKDTYVRG